MKDYLYNKYDLEAAKILDDFLPGKLFDMHMHLSHLPCGPRAQCSFDSYYSDMKTLIGTRELKANALVLPVTALKKPEEREKSVDFLTSQLNEYKENTGEILVFPQDTADDIKKQLTHPAIRGLKCYHLYAEREKTFDANIEEYLPESAWEVAREKNMFITLHMVKDKSLADENNLNYIKAMAKKYPDVVLILAHAARAFAAWTAFGTVDELKGFENVWYDFSSICESPSITYILKKIGVKRCMWGTDHPISMSVGKAISLGESFYWIGEKELKSFAASTAVNARHVGTEEFMAIREAAILSDLTRNDIEDLFYNNAMNLIKK